MANPYTYSQTMSAFSKRGEGIRKYSNGSTIQPLPMSSFALQSSDPNVQPLKSGYLETGATDATKERTFGTGGQGNRAAGYSAVAGAAAEMIPVESDTKKIASKPKAHVAKGTLKAAGQGAAAGATLGASIGGPYGAAIGAVVGTIAGTIKGLITSKKQVREATHTVNVAAKQTEHSGRLARVQEQDEGVITGGSTLSPTSPYVGSNVKSLKSGGETNWSNQYFGGGRRKRMNDEMQKDKVVAEVTGDETIIPKGWDDAIERAYSKGNYQDASNIYRSAPKVTTAGKFSHEKNPIMVLDTGHTYHKDGSSDVNIYAGSGVFNPKQHKQMKQGKVATVFKEQIKKGTRS